MDEYAMNKAPGRGYRYLSPSDPDILLPFGHGASVAVPSLTRFVPP